MFYEIHVREICWKIYFRDYFVKKNIIHESSIMWFGITVHKKDFISDCWSVKDSNRFEDLTPISLSSISDNVYIGVAIYRHTSPDHHCASAKSENFVSNAGLFRIPYSVQMIIRLFLGCTLIQHSYMKNMLPSCPHLQCTSTYLLRAAQRLSVAEVEAMDLRLYKSTWWSRFWIA